MYTFSTSECQKVVRDRQFLTLLTYKCASCHKGAHFFDISTSQSAPALVCFVHFDFTTTVRAFSASQRPKVVRDRQFLTLLTWKRASRHNSAMFPHLNFQTCSEREVFWVFLPPNVLRALFRHLNFEKCPGSAPTALASLLFEPQIIGKTKWIVTSLPFPAPAYFFPLFLLSDLLTSFLLHLCFSNCPYCRRFHF